MQKCRFVARLVVTFIQIGCESTDIYGALERLPQDMCSLSTAVPGSTPGGGYCAV
ncbi:hypothetical protein Hypma_008355, partial [Hypsizygus marmoreus]